MKKTSQPTTKADLIDSQVNASIGDDAQHIGDVALVESSQAFLLEDVFGTVHNARVLACLSQRQACLQHLRGEGRQAC